MAVKSKLNGPVLPVSGVRISVVAAGVRYPNRPDLVILELSEGTTTVGVFTRNAFCAAPVTVARSHLKQGSPRLLLINTGNANAGTGRQGVDAALLCCDKAATVASASLGQQVSQSQVLPFSTGVIGEPLPVGKIVAALPGAMESLGGSDWEAAARGIMTTDTRPKVTSVQVPIEGATLTITGMAKGAGMIRPDMATMLAFVCTDALIEKPLLQALLNEAVSNSFNRITVDGDTSTNDACVLCATGKSGVRVAPDDHELHEKFATALLDLFRQLATEIIRDAEGASKFITIEVINGGTSRECLAVAYAVAESPLVKTAMYASDPNWGRILAAVGRAGIENLAIDDVVIDLGATRLVENGGVAPGYSEALGQAEMEKEEISVTIDLARGKAREKVWTADFSEDYVRINANYRT